MDIPDEFKRSVEYGAGDEWSDPEGWTIRDYPEYVPDLGYKRRLYRRVVYYGPWEEAE